MFMIVQLISQLLLCEIFFKLGTKDDANANDTALVRAESEVKEVLLQTFDSDAELQRKMWSILTRGRTMTGNSVFSNPNSGSAR